MYGLSKSQRDYGYQKIDNQKLFLDSNFIKIGNDYIPYSNFFKNAYINSNRYIAEVQNRVWSLYDYAKARDLKNIFITLTLPSEYHRYKKFKGRLVKNPKYIDDVSHNPKNGNLMLSSFWSSLLNDRSMNTLSRFDRVYFRVTEPHKDGTPHLHISLFVPKDSVDDVVAAVKRKFPFPQSKVETEVRNPVSYLMKYILKTFDDLRYGDDKISDLSLWYIVNKITRLYTSRTLISLDVYRALGGRYSLNQLTYMVKNREICVFVDPDTNKPLEICDKYGTIWNKKTFYENVNFNNMRVEQKPTLRKKISRIPVTIDDDNYILTNDGVNMVATSPLIVSKTSDYVLLNYYNSLDIEDDDLNLQHFGLVQNELSSRYLIDVPIQSLNDFNCEFDCA